MEELGLIAKMKELGLIAKMKELGLIAKMKELVQNKNSRTLNNNSAITIIQEMLHTKSQTLISSNLHAFLELPS